MMKNKGITLVALVVTIIIMLILAGVTLNIALGDNGLIKQTKKAADLAKESMKNEEEDVGKLVNQLDEVIKESLPSTVKEAIETEEIFTVNKKITDESGKTMVVPKGFKVIEETNIDSGVVIADGEGNEFVWVPCEDGEYKKHVYDVKQIDDATTTLADGVNKEKGWTTLQYRKYSDWKDEVDEVANIKSVEDNKGFYIARYEAGVPKNADFYVEASAEGVKNKNYPQSKNDISDNIKPVSKKGVQTWNLISQINAKTVSERMYSGESYGVRSQLVDGTAWDTAVTWMSKEYVGIEKNSTNYGNYNNTPTKEITGLYAAHTYSDGWQLATSYGYGKKSIGGRSSLRTEIATGLVNEFKLKNIYDMAGNMYEWTTEYGYHDGGTSSTKYVVQRGGCPTDDGGVHPVSVRSGYWAETVENNPVFGFRVVLYVK